MDKKDFIEWVEKLQDSYVPSEATLNQLANIDLVALVGPTGVGKSTVITELGIPYVMSDVTREQRPDELHSSITYHFRNDYLKIIDEVKNGEYVQFLQAPTGEFYGTRLSAYPESGLCVMAILAGVIPKFKSLGFRSVKNIYLMPPSYIEWMRRISGVRSRDLLARIDEARQSILLSLQDDSYYFVLNDTLELAVNEVKAIMNNQPVDQHRAQLARDTADIILERIGDESV